MATTGPVAAVSPVTVSLDDLRTGSVSLASLEEAFGPESLGIIVVKDLPSHYVQLRHRLLSLSSYLANLPSEELAKLEHPTAKYLTGWSLGKETLKSNRPDTLKGSYYVNCAFHQDPTLQCSPSSAPNSTKTYTKFPEYTAPNVWPADAVLPGFREAFQELCSLIIDVAALVAGACDRYAEIHVEGYDTGYLQRVVEGSMTTKARLLHYFPPPQANGHAAAEAEKKGEHNDDEDDWCATHLDHGCLTGLTSAMYVDEAAHQPTIRTADGNVTLPALLPELDSAPDPQAGLYVHSRTAAVTKVSIPRDCLAFQTGEALEVITKGAFRAVPHFVRGAASGNGGKVARNTLAVFTQPNLWEVVDKERGVDFAGFARGVVEKHY